MRTMAAISGDHFRRKSPARSRLSLQFRAKSGTLRECSVVFITSSRLSLQSHLLPYVHSGHTWAVQAGKRLNCCDRIMQIASVAGRCQKSTALHFHECTCHRLCFDKNASIVKYDAEQLKSVLHEYHLKRQGLQRRKA